MTHLPSQQPLVRWAAVLLPEAGLAEVLRTVRKHVVDCQRQHRNHHLCSSHPGRSRVSRRLQPGIPGSGRQYPRVVVSQARIRQ